MTVAVALAAALGACGARIPAKDWVPESLPEVSLDLPWPGGDDPALVWLLGDGDCPLCVDEVRELADLESAFGVPVRFVLTGSQREFQAILGDRAKPPTAVICGRDAIDGVASKLPQGYGGTPILLVATSRPGRFRVFSGSVNRARVLAAAQGARR